MVHHCTNATWQRKLAVGPIIYLRHMILWPEQTQLQHTPMQKRQEKWNQWLHLLIIQMTCSF